jgi:hypothetical protein
MRDYAMFNRWSIDIIFCCFVSLPLFNLSIVNAAEIRNGVKQVSQDIATGNRVHPSFSSSNKDKLKVRC